MYDTKNKNTENEMQSTTNNVLVKFSSESLDRMSSYSMEEAKQLFNSIVTSSNEIKTSK